MNQKKTYKNMITSLAILLSAFLFIGCGHSASSDYRIIADGIYYQDKVVGTILLDTNEDNASTIEDVVAQYFGKDFSLKDSKLVFESKQYKCYLANVAQSLTPAEEGKKTAQYPDVRYYIITDFKEHTLVANLNNSKYYSKDTEAFLKDYVSDLEK
ncbi:MAG: hypothetical protein II080_03420 [Lachnospiraceae bacterium]|nr:hypothetical protein [Lachnospiraceae bacterium]